jgi:carbamoyltransferase
MTGSPHVYSGDSYKDVHFDLAASVHALLREEVCDLLRSVPEGGRAGTVALSGGVFQSWTLNDALAAEFPSTRFVVSFAPGNASCAIGGPLVSTSYANQRSLSPFLGPNYTQNDVKAVLDNCKARYELHSFRQAISLVCDALMQGDMVGWFSGPCEFGYRALGARSVFANPANPYACDNLSSFLKRRPSYFTYAVAMKDCDAPGIDSPHLSRSTRLPEYFGDSPVRIQTVSSTTNPVLYQLLETFQAKSGVPALLNTSLNYFDEPIACTPRDALKTFYASGLDVLVIENFVLRKT